MPYRRLPNTDLARMRALKAALDISTKKSRNDLAFSFLLLQKIDIFLPGYETAIRNYRQAVSQQSQSSKDYNKKQRKAKLYVSHFIQVLNFAIIREELKPEVREYYGLKKNSKTTPALMQDAKIIEWGEKLLKGEQLRISKGGNAIYSPSIALVRVACESFKQVFNHQKILRQNTQRLLDNVAQYRNEADALILKLWNEVETFFEHLEDEEKRKACSEYGVVYVWRRGERERLEKLKEVEKNTLTLPFADTQKNEHEQCYN